MAPYLAEANAYQCYASRLDLLNHPPAVKDKGATHGYCSLLPSILPVDGDFLVAVAQTFFQDPPTLIQGQEEETKNQKPIIQ